MLLVRFYLIGTQEQILPYAEEHCERNHAEQHIDTALVRDQQILGHRKNHDLYDGVHVVAAEHRDELETHQDVQHNLNEFHKLTVRILRQVGPQIHHLKNHRCKNKGGNHNLRPHRGLEKTPLHAVQ